MKRPLKPEELRVWARVASTVHPLPGRAAPTVEDAAPEAPSPALPPKTAGPALAAPTPKRPKPPPAEIEPRRKHRLAKERDDIGARIDLHGMTYDRAHAGLEAFIQRAYDEGYRAVLVITGKGVSGDGILRRATPEWLAAPALRDKVAGISEAHRRHGGSGALYVALKRKPKG